MPKGDKIGFTPVCAECKYLFTKEEKGIFHKIKYAGCSAQGYKMACDVYGNEKCFNIFNQQIKEEK